MFGIGCDTVMNSIVSTSAVPTTDVCTMRMLRNLRLSFTHAHAFDTFGEMGKRPSRDRLASIERRMKGWVAARRTHLLPLAMRKKLLCQLGRGIVRSEAKERGEINGMVEGRTRQRRTTVG